MTYKLRYGNKEIIVPTSEELKNHSHTWSNITSKPTTFAPTTHNQDWSTITGKPSAFSPSNHSHAYATWLGAQYASGGDWLGWYNTYGGTRRGYIQNSGDFHIQNETGGIVHLGTGGSYAGNVYLEKGSSTYPNGFFYPSGSGGCCLGIQANRWLRYYGVSASNISSDKRLKSDFSSFDKRYIDLFESIDPIIYKIIANKNSSKEAGYIAQDVELAMKKCGISQEEFGVYEIDENGIYSLTYQSLDMLLVYYVKEKNKEMQKLTEEVDKMENEVNKLKQIILNFN